MPNILRKLAHLNIDRALRTQARAIIISNYFEPNKQASPWALTGHDAQQTETAGLSIQSADQEVVERGREGRFRIGVGDTPGRVTTRSRGDD